MKRKKIIYIQAIIISGLIITVLTLTGSRFPAGTDELIIRNYDDVLKVITDIDPASPAHLFQFRNVGEETLVVILTPYKYRPYLNEFDALPSQQFTKEGYDNYLEFEMKPGDIQWREFEISPVNIWKVNIEVRRKK